MPTQSEDELAREKVSTPLGVRGDSEKAYAPMLDRFTAIMVDTALLTAITIFICLFGGGFLSLNCHVEFSDPISYVRHQVISPITWITLIIYISYYTYFEGTKGQTLGKFLSRVVVIDAITGDRIGMGSAFIRSLLRLVDWLPLAYILGILLIITTKKRQRIGDMVAKTVVVKTASHKSNEEIQSKSSSTS